METATDHRRAFYARYLLLIAGLGGLLYGVDIGVISAALLYVGKTIDLTVVETSAIVAAVLAGSMVSSLLAGLLADWLGRKKMMIVSGLLFVVSVALIVGSRGFAVLLAGRLLQGMSGGVIAVVVPLYLAESLSAEKRGRGTAIFQFMLTFGVVVASLTGWYFIREATFAIDAAHGNPWLIRAAEDHAWRSMFMAVIYPGLCFFAGTFFLTESPRWLYRKGRIDEALAVCRRALSPQEARAEMAQMEAAVTVKQNTGAKEGSLLQRKYIFPFLLACAVLICTQASGVNSILSYQVLILKQAGMTAPHAAQGDLLVKLLHCLVTIVAIPLIDARGRKFLLTIGTGGLFISLLGVAFLFHGIESTHTDVRTKLESAIGGNSLQISAASLKTWSGSSGKPVVLSILYSYGDGEKSASLNSDANETLRIEPAAKHANARLMVHRAELGPAPGESSGWIAALLLAIFISSHSIGPGVVVWLVLSELMPIRIRSVGMGIALVLNQGVSTSIAGAFLSVVTHFGYATLFGCCAVATAGYFLLAVFVLPETKGKSLEEIEQMFEGSGKARTGNKLPGEFSARM